ncbi:MAG: arsenic efflux protein [Clostridia bacterium]|nr:arsenic efflux protein [Clostridia bacterium]
MAYWEVFCDVIIDTLKVLPILLVAYFLIEIIEYKWATKLQNNRFLQGKASPVLAALVGSVPQCGFSVVAVDLFSQGMISIGALLAVFISTSDEALPLLLSHPQNWLSIVVLIALKIFIAIIVGYLANLVFRLIHRRGIVVKQLKVQEQKSKPVDLHDGCCHHSLEEKHFNWLHPLLHSLKIWLFIFTVSLLFGFVADIWVGEDRLTAFLSSSFWLQPLFAVIVGLVPNCASSVILAELYLVVGLRFGALLGGLCVNAGLGVIFLLRQKKIWQEKLFVVTCLIGISILVGYAFMWLVI